MLIWFSIIIYESCWTENVFESYQRDPTEFRVTSVLILAYEVLKAVYPGAEFVRNCSFLAGWFVSYYLSTTRFMATVISMQLPLKFLWTKAVDGPTSSLCVSFEFLLRTAADWEFIDCILWDMN